MLFFPSRHPGLRSSRQVFRRATQRATVSSAAIIIIIYIERGFSFTPSARGFAVLRAEEETRAKRRRKRGEREREEEKKERRERRV